MHPELGPAVTGEGSKASQISNHRSTTLRQHNDVSAGCYVQAASDDSSVRQIADDPTAEPMMPSPRAGLHDIPAIASPDM